LWTIGLVLLFLGSFIVLIQFSFFQTWLAGHLTKYLSKELKTTIVVDMVHVNFLSGFTLKGVYVEDLHKDTLLYAEKIKLGINDFSSAAQKIIVKNIELEKAAFHLNLYEGEEHDNIYFLTEYFSGSGSDSDTSGTAWDVRFENIKLKDVSFKRWIEGDTLSPVGINFSDIYLSQINGDFKDLYFSGDSLFVDVQKLSFLEKSGFEVKDFHAETKIAGDQMRFNSLFIKSPYTEINGQLTFDYDSFADFNWFTKLIHWKADFIHTDVSFRDIAFFAHDIWGIKNTVSLEGNFRGTVNKFKGKNVILKWGEKSILKGNVGLYGLPYISETFMDVQADEIITNKKDVEQFPLYPFTDGKFLQLPSNMETLGNVKFTGKFTGFYSDFVAYGNITTALGYLSSDINLKYDKETSNYIYKGHVSATKFDVGTLTSMNDIGKVSFNAQVKGSGLHLENIDARMTGNVQSIEFRKYAYRNIKVDGELSKRLFSGALTIHEPNINLDFEGTIDFRDSLPLFNFTAMIENANLDSLHIINLPEENVLRTSISSSLRGNKLDNLEGSIDINNTFLRSGKKMYRIGNILLSANKVSDNLKSLKLNSDFMDADFEGEFELATLGEAFKEILPRYLPSVILPVKSNPGKQNFKFNINLRNTSLITEVFLPSWTIDPMTFLNGTVNTTTRSFDLNLSSPSIRYTILLFRNLDLQLQANDHDLSLDAVVERFNFSENAHIPNVKLHSIARNNIIQADLQLANSDTFSNRAHLKAALEFFSATRFDLKFDSSLIVLRNKPWNISASNIVAFDTSTIRFSSLNFSSLHESVDVDGNIGKSSTENLRLNFHNFNLNNLDPLLQLGNSKLGGTINGDMVLNEARSSLKAETDLEISNLILNDDTLGNAKFISRYNNEQKIVVANIDITKGSAKIVELKGKYYAAKSEDNLDFDVHINNFYLKTIERYIDEVLSEVRGKVSADLKLTGTIDKPVIEGTVDFARASCIVNYLNTKYSFTNRVKVRKNVFDLNGVTVIDKDNNEAKVKGKISHEFFDHFVFDVEVYPSNFQMLNTSYSQNSLYYGNAVVSGYAHFYGPLNLIGMDINLVPAKGTLINIPLSNAAEVTKSDFITFVDHSKDYDYDEKPRTLVTNSGIRLNMNLEMNPNATINLIFDEKIGDVITGSGDGSIRLDIDQNGVFTMYGTYSISKGEYLFTLQNLINKKFNIDAGSHITWAGDPYEANVDLSAVYVLYTSSLYNLVQDSTYKRRLPVECRLFLTNKLLNPTINYDISVRGLDPAGESIVKSILTSEQEVSKQMFSLLLLNQFSPPSNQSASSSRIDAGAGAGASASELLSNQVSNWLGRLSKDVNIGINYRSRDNYSNEEIQLLFAKTLFNDRLLVEGNVGYMSNQNQNTNDLVGDFYAEYKVSEDGRFRLKGFNRSNADNVLNYSAPYTQGFGVFFRQEFNNLHDLKQRLGLFRKKNESSKE
jgi:hypothetical protein